VEFTGGAELATPVEKAMADLARDVSASVEKAVRVVEKVAAGRRGEIEIEEGVRPCSGMVEMLAGRPKNAVGNNEAVRRSAVMVEHHWGAVVESLLENEGNKLWLEVSGREYTTTEPLG
jgi:hypothetical protein